MGDDSRKRYGRTTFYINIAYYIVFLIVFTLHTFLTGAAYRHLISERGINICRQGANHSSSSSSDIFLITEIPFNFTMKVKKKHPPLVNQ